MDLLDNALMGRCFEIFDKLIKESTTTYGKICFEDLAGFENEKRPLINAILGDKVRGNGVAIFRSASAPPIFQQSMTIKYT